MIPSRIENSLCSLPYRKSSAISGKAFVSMPSSTHSIFLLTSSCDISIVLRPSFFCNAFATVVFPLPEFPLRMINFPMCCFFPFNTKYRIFMTVQSILQLFIPTDNITSAIIILFNLYALHRHSSFSVFCSVSVISVTVYTIASYILSIHVHYINLYVYNIIFAS